MSKDNRLNIAVIGCGYWGPNLVRNFSKIEDCAVKYVCDKREDRLKWIRPLYPSINATRDYRQILKDPYVDAVAIATPVKTHFALAKEFLKAGKHVLVEKPLCSTSVEAAALLDLAKKKKRVLMVSHTCLYSPGIRKIKEIIGKRALGKILYVNSVRVNLGLFQKDINVVMDLAPHDISAMNFILGKNPERLSCVGAAHYTRGVEDVAFINLYYPGNVTAHIHVSWIDPVKIRKLTVVGSEAMAVYNDLEIDEPLKLFEKSASRIPYYKTYGEFKMLYKFGDTYSPRLENQEPLNVQCSHFIDCVMNNKTPLTNGEQGLYVVRLLELANRSLRDKGRLLKVDGK